MARCSGDISARHVRDDHVRRGGERRSVETRLDGRKSCKRALRQHVPLPFELQEDERRDLRGASFAAREILHHARNVPRAHEVADAIDEESRAVSVLSAAPRERRFRCGVALDDFLQQQLKPRLAKHVAR